MKKRSAKQPDNIYELHDSESAQALYTDWASRYDQDLIDNLGWSGHLAVADKIAELTLAASTAILDAGCGTGLCGAALSARGYTTIVGVDLTENMLERARDKGVYRELHQMDLTAELFFTASFEVVCTAGVFSHGPVLPSHIEGLLKPLRADGYAVHTINGLAYGEFAYRDALDALVARGVVELVEDTAIDYNVKANVPGRLVVCRKLKLDDDQSAASAVE